MKLSTTLLLAALAASSPLAFGQAGLAPWGDLQGLRIDGQRFPFLASVHVLGADGHELGGTGHYRVEPQYRRTDKSESFASSVGGVKVSEDVAYPAAGSAEVTFELAPANASEARQVEWRIALPAAAYADATLAWLATGQPAQSGKAVEARVEAKATGLRIATPERQLELRFPEPLAIAVERNDAGVLVHVELAGAELANAAAVARRATITVSGAIDRAPVHVTLQPERTGEPFAGVGGDFRIQFPEKDPAIIAYNLDHMRVAWARTCLWWKDWDPNEAEVPSGDAATASVTPRIAAQIESDARLAARGIPLIVSTWDPAAWAIQTGPRRPGTYGDPLNPAKLDRIAQGITAYLRYLKDAHHIEPVAFSLNEPDIGVQVPQTPEEHVRWINTLGAAFARAGLKTKLLLGDTSNATPRALALVRAGVADPECRPYVAAVAFHTWGGCEDENLTAWAQAARGLGVPLLVTEAGPDSEAHRNPDLFASPEYQLAEAALYTRIAAVAQPATIMEWQLTADYSVLAGGGAYGHEGPLQPTFRFWILEQLGATAPGSRWTGVTVDRPDIVAAAFGDASSGRYAVHLVNDGAERTALISGLPAHARLLRVESSDAAHGHCIAAPVAYHDGAVEVTLPATAMTSVFVDGGQ